MNTFLVDGSQFSDQEVIKIAADCLQQKVEGVHKINKGGNGKVYQVICPDKQYVIKFYFQSPTDKRDRLGTEFKSLSFLWEQGVQATPRPVAVSRKNQCAFYEFVEGEQPSGDISTRDIDRAVEFIRVLRGLSKVPQASDFSAASEAFFSARDIVGSIKLRLKRFYFEEEAIEYQDLQEYLQDKLIPLLDSVEEWSKVHLIQQGISWDEELLGQYRTLSPSDFGFHNALRLISGKMVFLDFEYFGWDDPSKLASDFLWHPAMSLTEDLKHYFVKKMTDVFAEDTGFKTRLRAFFPLFGLKWCLIFLNEFIAADLRRRDFANTLIKPPAEVRFEQLGKAKQLAVKIKTMYKDFSYGF